MVVAGTSPAKVVLYGKASVQPGNQASAAFGPVTNPLGGNYWDVGTWPVVLEDSMYALTDAAGVTVALTY